MDKLELSPQRFATQRNGLGNSLVTDLNSAQNIVEPSNKHVHNYGDRGQGLHLTDLLELLGVKEKSSAKLVVVG